jgi:hypothetical protein
VVFQRIVIHQDLFADFPSDDGYGTSTGDDPLELVPSSSNASTVSFEHLLEGHGHFFFKHGGSVDVSRDTVEFSTVITLSTETGEPFPGPTGDG